MDRKIVSLLIGGLALSGVARAAAPDWTYSGAAGPANWAKLAPENGACAGKNQSPINLTHAVAAKLKPIRFAYQAGGNEIVNNGHTVQVNYAAGSHIVVDDTRFDLKQFHFHAPSENLIDGRSYPLEAHLVHVDKDGNLAVVAVLFEEGHASAALAQIWPAMPKEAGAKDALPVPFAAAKLLPARRDYYSFSGSLTTPPCSEGVRWLVLKRSVPTSKEQVEAFANVIHHPNNRPVQPAYARTVLK